MIRLGLALTAILLTTSPGAAQVYYGAGSSGAPLPNAFSPIGRPGVIRFNQGSFHGQPNYRPGRSHGHGHWGYNPYLNYYNSSIGYRNGFGYATPGIFYQQPYYSDYVVPATPAPAVPDPNQLPPPAQLPSPDTSVAYIDLHVPAAAKVWAQGVEMAAKGTFRRFITPPLDPGVSHSYEFHIVADGGTGKPMVQTISVVAGDRKSLTIFAPASK